MKAKINYHYGPETQEVIEELKNSSLKASPFLANRIVKDFERKRGEKSQKWRSLIAVAACFILVFVAQFAQIENSSMNMIVGKSYMVKIDVTEFDSGNWQFAEVVLPQEIEFVSRKFPSIRKQSRLKFSSRSLNGKRFLPLLLKGTNEGVKELEVIFYNNESEVVGKKQLRFKIEVS